MDYARLRAEAMSSGEDEEAVTVNTRALIDKVLARYSGEWTTLRELLQNAADACASTVKIKFETLPSAQVSLSNATNESEILKHVLLHHTLGRLLVTNDGHPFGVNDWSRLKRIAEGNPDETKIGAFGVGFYSVFADCEEPFVSSGSEAMAFYWKGNSLFTRKLQLPQHSPDTTFVLEYRNTTSPIPDLLSLSQFLSTSLTFVALEKIELWLDDWMILALEKKVAPSVQFQIPKDVEAKTKEGLMSVQGLERQSLQMDATYMKVVGWKPSSLTVVPRSSAFADNTYGLTSEASSLRSFFSRLTANPSQSSLKIKTSRDERDMKEAVLEDLTALTTANVFLSVTTGTIRTYVATSFALELEHATKKPPPKTIRLAILASSYDEAAASKAVTKHDSVAGAVDVFASVLPGKKPGGRIFIGFPTHQTTGAGIHLSAPSIIPTVERESIDLNARRVRTWNMEMLRAAGIITRLAFTREMSELGSKVTRAAESIGRGTKITQDDIEKFVPEALHILQTFTFIESTPSSQVSQIIDESFWTAYKKAYIEIYSTQGVLPTTVVRLATEDLSGFVEGIPVIPKALLGSPFVVKLRELGLIMEINVDDVKKELGAKALTKNQLTQFIVWAGNKASTGKMDASTIRGLLDNVVAMVGEDDSQGGIITLSTIKHYVNATKILPDMPFPPDTLPFEFTRSLGAKELQALGWEPIEIAQWLRFLVESIGGRNGLSTEFDISWSPRFSAQVLAIISKQWESLGQIPRETIIGLLRAITVIPTKYGMMIPSETYFQNVKLFDDLPIISPMHGVKEKLLLALGVRKTVELDTIFQRLLDPSELTDGEKRAPKWSHVDLITYLASVKDDIPTDDLKKLRSTPICTAEAGPTGGEASKGTSKRYKFSELFEPIDTLRGLGLPIIRWTGKPFRPSSQEGKFLSFLGLRATPVVNELLVLMASENLSLRDKAMAYFIKHYEMNGYSKVSLAGTDIPFLPIQGDEKKLVTPAACFVNEKAALLGFNVLHRSLVPHANKFQVAGDPPMIECVNRLISKPPQSRRDAITLFSYFANRLGEIGQNHVAKLGDAPIVPVSVEIQQQGSIVTKQSKKIRHIAPHMVFIGTSMTYKDIFDFVDFSLEANSFLLHCGSKHEPSRAQVASMLASEPARVLGIVQSPDRYLSLLRMIADSLSELKKDKALFKQLATSASLLAMREIPGKSMKGNEKTPDSSSDLDEDDEDATIKQWTLQPANNIVIVDDYNSYRLFKEALLCAPMEENLENLYLALGSSSISSLVREDTRLGPVISEKKTTAKLQRLILERTKLFLHEYPPENVKHDSKWIEKNLSIEMVSNIASRRSLRGYHVSHTAQKTATLNHDYHKGWILFITEHYDWYHISQALVGQLLTRPNNQATTLFEFLLNTDLRDLKRRGFNVDRILRAKAVEARIAEDERRRLLEEETRVAREQEQQWKQNQSVTTVAHENRPRSTRVAMPGAFGGDSPESSPPAQEKKPRGILSNITRHLGMNENQVQEQLQKFLTGTGNLEPEGQANRPPPYYDDQANRPPPYYGGNSHGLTPEPKPSKPASETERVTSPHALQQNLLNAIKSSRPYDSSKLFSPPVTNTVKEQASYCDAKPSLNISYIGEAWNGMRIFITKDITTPATVFLTQHATSLGTFATLLREVGDVYTLPPKTIHIFYDEVGSTIAFNSQGSIFCNFRFFQQLHERKVENRTAEGRNEAVSWWWIVIAHELAHNIVAQHSSEHSYYTESFIAQYFPKMVAKAISYTQSF